MRETTAEIWIGPDQSSDWIGTLSGINASYLLLLRENSRPSWMLLPGNFHDPEPPKVRLAGAWVPTPSRPLEDALLLFAALGAKEGSVRDALAKLGVSLDASHFDLSALFPKGLPNHVYELSRESLVGWRVVVSIGDSSLAKSDLASLRSYAGLKIEVRLPAGDLP
jgi:hypothetical protein